MEREKEDRLNRMARNLPGVIYEFCATDNGEWSLNYASERMVEIFGLSFEKVRGFFSFLPHVYEEDREAFKTSVTKAIETCSPWNFEGRFIKPSGEKIWFHGLSTPTRHEDCVIFDGIFLDITERKKAEELSLLSEEKFSKVFMMTPAIIAITRMKDGLIDNVNIGFEEITGWKRDEVIGRTSTDINFWDNPADREFMVETLKAGCDIVHQDSAFRHKDGSLRTGSYSARFIEIGGEAFLIFVMRDITERKQAEERFRLSEEKFTKVFMTAPDGISITRITDGLIIDTNLGFGELSGWERSEVLGRTSLETNFWADLTERAHLLNELKAGRDVQQREFQFRKKDGTLRNGIYSARPIQIDSEACIIFICQDITEKKNMEAEHRKLEQQLNQMQKMEAIGQLAGGVAHDFNNILLGIQGNASMLMMEYNPEHPHYQRLNRIEEYVRRGAELTRQLLGFAREGKYEPKTLFLNDLIRKSAQFFIETRKEIEGRFELQEDLHPIEADAGQLEQVFLNIFINAAHAMPKGGCIHIATNNVTLQENDVTVFQVAAGDYIKVSISDTGTGMDAKTLEKIFEPFFTTKSQQGGTGLGLASAYGIIRNHGGIIKAYSEPGQGATFTIYLPSSGSKIEKKEKQEVDQSLQRGSGEILVVDDEPFILELASELLQMLGYTVHRAENEEDAVSIYREKWNRIDLVILDMILRGKNGSEVLKALRTINPVVKVILSSGYSLQGEVQEVMEMGCIGFIQKPYNFAEFSKAVHQALTPPEQTDA